MELSFGDKELSSGNTESGFGSGELSFGAMEFVLSHNTKTAEIPINKGFHNKEAKIRVVRKAKNLSFFGMTH